MPTPGPSRAKRGAPTQPEDPGASLGLPPRYELLHELGRGGGGAVWAVRDRSSGQTLALKLLAADASEAAALALVREATALSGLEGLGVPRVVAFGTLGSAGGGRRYFVRELALGRSLDGVLGEDRSSGSGWLEPLARAAEQLTALHRAGMLHGDVKPANIIVGEGGVATLVDLGLATPWREGGGILRGLTPKYAAPELFLGEPLTVRAEVYALGATLLEAIERRGHDLPSGIAKTLSAIGRRATEKNASARYPSAAELASAVRHAAGLPESARFWTGWPVLGLDAVSQALAMEVSQLAAGGALALEGGEGSGRTTLARRLAWSLGIVGRHVLTREDLETSNEPASADVVLVIDDLADVSAATRADIERRVREGARLVAVAPTAAVKAIAPRHDVRRFEVPPLELTAAIELVRRALPSLPESLRTYVVDKGNRRPGTLRAHLRTLARSVVVSREEVDLALDPAGAIAGGATGTSSPPKSSSSSSSLSRSAHSVPSSRSSGRPIDETDAWGRVEDALDRGRFEEAAEILAEMGELTDGEEPVRAAVAHARLALGRGDGAEAEARLASVGSLDRSPELAARWSLTRARTELRAGQFARAAEHARAAARGPEADVNAEAMAVEGLAQVYIGEEAAGMERLGEAKLTAASARLTRGPRAEGVVLGLLAIAHQRGGRGAEARETYTAGLAAAESARDAATVATLRVNLASLAQTEGDFAQALAHLEAAVDLGGRAGGFVAVQQARLNLASLDLFLGRYSRARAALGGLDRERKKLTPPLRAYLLALEAELAIRTGDVERSVVLYEECAQQYDALGRAHDAAEARLEGILARALRGGTSVSDVEGSVQEKLLLAGQLTTQLERIRAVFGDSGLGEHAALHGIARGSVAWLAGDEPLARAAFDEAYAAAKDSQQREWAWRALDARSRLAATQGARALARRDSEEALALLEETAAKLPRDLREVFWDDPRRRALRLANESTFHASGELTEPRGSFALRGSHGSGTSTHSAPATSPTGHFGPAGSTHFGRPTDDRLVRILEITRELASETDLERLLGKVVDHAIALLGGERGIIVLAGDDGKLEVRTARGKTSEEEPHARFSRSVAERVIATGEAVLAPRAREDERLAEAASVHQLMIESVACVPVRAPSDKTIGALYIETQLRPGARFKLELPTLAAFADQAAIAIENARLLAENRRRAEQLEVANLELSAARDKLSQSLDRRTEQLETVRRDLKDARATLRGHFGYGGLVGTSAAMRKLYAVLDRVKDTDVPVLVTGESGTGKEVVAKTLHSVGRRARGPYLAINCGAIPANLLESELFGHVRGAFTGADRDRLGLFREASGGTVLLDEIGEMPLSMQPALLRVLQEGKVRPVGGATEEPCDVRIVAATNRTLERMVEDGSFREDLFYRLQVVELHVPPLRERSEDIAPLVDHFLTLFAARHRRERGVVSREALRRLSTYDWPGNVRQLEHVLLNAWLMSDATELDAGDIELPSAALGGLVSTGANASVAPPTSSSSSSSKKPISSGSSSRSASTSSHPGAKAPRVRAQTPEEFKQADKDRILAALTQAGWNRLKAAELLGIPRRTFYRRLREYGIL